MMHQRRQYNNNTRPTRRPFQEDPEKAVFLSGFREDIPTHQWKQYREEVYQAINKDYGVYITKLDLPVNSKFGYLHVRSAGQARQLLELPYLSERQMEAEGLEENQNGPCMQLAGNNVFVFEYKKTQKRRQEEYRRRETGNAHRSHYSGYSTRDVSPLRNTNTNKSSFDRDFTEVEQAPAKIGQDRSKVTVSQQNDSALQTHDVSDVASDSDECQNNNVAEMEPMNETVAVQSNQEVAEQTQAQETVEFQNETQEPSTTKSSFDEITDAFNNQDKLGQILLQQHWDDSFNTLNDMDQVYLMIQFMMEFRNGGADAAIKVFSQLKNLKDLIEIEQLKAQILSSMQC